MVQATRLGRRLPAWTATDLLSMVQYLYPSQGPLCSTGLQNAERKRVEIFQSPSGCQHWRGRAHRAPSRSQDRNCKCLSIFRPRCPARAVTVSPGEGDVFNERGPEWIAHDSSGISLSTRDCANRVADRRQSKTILARIGSKMTLRLPGSVLRSADQHRRGHADSRPWPRGSGRFGWRSNRAVL